jgi:hypothetical protein
MPLVSLEIEELAEIFPELEEPRPHRPAPLRLTFPDLSQSYLPGRGLFYSSLIHELLLVAVVLLTFQFHRTLLPRQRLLTHMIDLGDAAKITYLPTLGGGEEGNGRPGGSPGISHRSSAPAHSQSSKGIAYPGPQPIVSDSPNPTNQNQTVLHPSAEKPRVLKQFVPLPNIVRMANSGVKLPSDLLAAKPAMPELQVAPSPAVEKPKLPVPESPPPPAPITVAREARKAAQSPVAAPKIAKLPSQGNDLETIVSLSPTPAMPEPAPKLPEGEARGRFAVSPEANVTAENTPGSKKEGAASSAVIGKQAGTGSGNAVEVAIGPGVGVAASASGAGGGTGTGIGAANGSGKGGTGNENARGSGTGTGLGTTSGTASASGAGGGSGTGQGSFAGITIQRGSTANLGVSVATHVRARVSIPSQNAYGMTVVSLANSGGGLPDLGLFADEKVYTVYIDMRATTDDPAPSWTFQYALLHPSELSGNDQEGSAPPYPLSKQVPKLPRDLILKYLRDQVLVYAVLGIDGQLHQLEIKQTPDPLFNRPILLALKTWTFRPAQLNGQPVAIKVLLGVPVLPLE